MSGTELKIRIFGDAALRKRARSVTQITAQHRQVLETMTRLMRESSGIGLAAPQVGINENMIVADIGSGLYKLVNPQIIRKENRQVIEEGCLSIPGVCIKVRRAKKILLQAQDETGRPLNIEAEDLLACVLQHEIDHLKGRMIVDYASFLERFKIRRKLAELKKRPSDEKLPASKTKSCQLQL